MLICMQTAQTLEQPWSGVAALHVHSFPVPDCGGPPAPNQRSPHLSLSGALGLPV